MKADLDGQFSFRTDENNFILYEICFYGKDSKKQGETFEKVHGYYGTLEQCLKGYLRYSLLKDENCDNVEMILLKIESIQKSIHDFYTTCKE